MKQLLSLLLTTLIASTMLVAPGADCADCYALPCDATCSGTCRCVDDICVQLNTLL